MARNSDEYEVGFGKPPRHARFQKGKSGNSRGRPRGSKNTNTLLAEELNETVTVLENGQHKRITKREALIKQMVNRGFKTKWAAQLLLDEMRKHDQEQKLSKGPPIETPEEQFQRFVEVGRVLWECGAIDLAIDQAEREGQKDLPPRRFPKRS
ncbi:MAG: DUF5681 domain-containing protein [Candidatus Binataceae bacterium]